MSYERWALRREAVARAIERRHRNAWRLGALSSIRALDPSAKALVASLEKAVFAADLTYAYRSRLEGVSVESPFEIRRSWVESSLHAYWEALDRVRASASRWLEHMSEGESSRQRHAVEHLAAFLEGGPPPEVAGQAFIESSIELMEVTLADLLDVSPSRRGIAFHPFRGEARLAGTRSHVFHPAPKPPSA